MHSAATVRRQIEAALETRIPSALTPRPRTVREQCPTGIAEVDALLEEIGKLEVDISWEMLLGRKRHRNEDTDLWQRIKGLERIDAQVV